MTTLQLNIGFTPAPARLDAIEAVKKVMQG